MSLITCPECNQSVSSKAPYCPHCGVAIAGNVKRCPKCGTYVLMNEEECPHCSARFAPQEPAVEKTTAAPVKPAAQTIEPQHRGTTEREDVNRPNHLSDNAESVADEGNATTANTPRQPKSHTPWYILALLILALAIGGFFYWENQNQQKTEEAAYQMLEGCKDPLNLEDFIAQYPNSKHADEVRERLKELQVAKDEWDKALSAGDVAHLRDFINEHPDSPFRKQALAFIDSLDWLAATTKGTTAAYQAYIEQHDNGEHIDEAYVARDEAEKREAQARRDSVASARARAALADSLAAAAAAAQAATGIDVLTE